MLKWQARLAEASSEGIEPSFAADCGRKAGELFFFTSALMLSGLRCAIQ